MRAEPLDRRVLGAVRFLDAPTGAPIVRPLVVAAEGVRFARNHRGAYAIVGAPGLGAHARAFAAPPATPARGAVEVVLTVRDPSGRYLPRRRTVALPRDPDPANAGGADSLFRFVDVPLYPAPAARVAVGWAIVRATVTRAGDGRGIAGALLRVVRASDAAHLASGLTDARGEALVAVPGIPVTTWGAGTGAVLASEIEVTLEAVVDPDAGEVADPDDLEARHASLRASSAALRLAAGRVVAVALAVTVP